MRGQSPLPGYWGRPEGEQWGQPCYPQTVFRRLEGPRFLDPRSKQGASQKNDRQHRHKRLVVLSGCTLKPNRTLLHGDKTKPCAFKRPESSGLSLRISKEKPNDAPQKNWAESTPPARAARRGGGTARPWPFLSPKRPPPFPAGAPFVSHTNQYACSKECSHYERGGRGAKSAALSRRLAMRAGEKYRLENAAWFRSSHRQSHPTPGR